MSTFNTITSLAESPKAEGLLYAGTDDGLLQVSEDGGKSWRKIEVGSLPGVPASAFVNDIKADLHDADTVYVALDDHKSGDFRPYLLKSTDRGRTWRSIAGDLPARNLVWRVVQDHVKPDLLFAGTEFGLFFTTDGGAPLGEARRRRADHRRSATSPSSGARTTSSAARFGRGFFVLDDYSALREVDGGGAREGGRPLPGPQGLVVRRARAARRGRQGLAGRRLLHGAEPAVRRGLHLPPRRRPPEPREDSGRRAEKPLVEAGKDTPYPGLGGGRGGAPRAEARGRADGEGRGRPRGAPHRGEGGEGLPPRGLGPAAALDPGRSAPARGPTKRTGKARRASSPPPAPTRSRSRSRWTARTTELAGPVRFEVARLRPGALPGSDPQQTAAFLRRVAEAERATTAATQAVRQALERAKALAHRARALALGARRARRRAPRDRAGAPRDRRGARRQPRPRHGRGRRRRHDLEPGAGGVHERRLVHLRPDADPPAQPRDRGEGVRGGARAPQRRARAAPAGLREEARAGRGARGPREGRCRRCPERPAGQKGRDPRQGGAEVAPPPGRSKAPRSHSSRHSISTRPLRKRTGSQT